MKTHTYYATLGNHPKLSRVELESVLKIRKSRLIGDVLEVHLDSPIVDNFIDRIGGSDRLLRHLATFDHFPTPAEMLAACDPLPKKWRVGISVIGLHDFPSVQKLGIDLKKQAREQSSKLAFVVPNGKSTQLNSAQVLFNRLHRSPNKELVFIPDEDSWILAETIQIQDIQKYELRDTKRPARDAKSGMLPPKLAQIMINIAVGHLSVKQDQSSSETRGKSEQRIRRSESLRRVSGGAFDEEGRRNLVLLDPFCGSGTLLQEGWLMGYQMVGADRQQKAIEMSADNLRWLVDHFDVNRDLEPEVLVHNAEYSFPADWEKSFSAVVTEPFLGKPLRHPLSPTDGAKQADKLGKLYKKFFEQAENVLMPGGTVVFIFPVLSTTDEPLRTSELVIDELQAFGYHQVHLSPTGKSLIYGRPDALVQREITLFLKQ